MPCPHVTEVRYREQNSLYRIEKSRIGGWYSDWNISFLFFNQGLLLKKGGTTVDIVPDAKDLRVGDFLIYTLRNSAIQEIEQMHTESIYTEHGKRMIENFVNGVI